MCVHCADELLRDTVDIDGVNVPLPSDVPREITVESGDAIVTMAPGTGSFLVCCRLCVRALR